LVVSNISQAGLDLSLLRIKFSIKRSGVMTPNIADIRVYNLDLDTAAIIKKEFTKVVLQAGYEGNYGVIFKGTIKQVILGRESPTDTFIDITAGDGEQAYNFAVVKASIAAGSSQADQLNAALIAMQTKGTSRGYVSALPGKRLPRGKVMYGNARDYIQGIAKTTDSAWSIQDEQINFLPNASYKPGTAVELTSKTGMIGTPQQTVMGVNCKCLLNPLIKVHGRVHINEASVQAYKIDFSVVGSQANTPVSLRHDGFYYVFVANHSGDTRGLEWYSDLVLLTINPANNPLNATGVSTS
jgi:hypothetical protein